MINVEIFLALINSYLSVMHEIYHPSPFSDSILAFSRVGSNPTSLSQPLSDVEEQLANRSKSNGEQGKRKLIQGQYTLSIQVYT